MKLSNPTQSVRIHSAQHGEPQPLVSPEELLQKLWSVQARPSRAWLRKMTKRGVIPVIRGGRRLFYDVEAVRKALLQQAEIDRLKQAANPGGYVSYQRRNRRRS